MSNVSISTNKLTIGYFDNSRHSSGAVGRKVVQSDLTFALQAGEMVCMLGPNGCGKSTLLRTLAGLQPALGGEYKLVTDGEEQTAREIALVLTERLSMDNTTVHDVVAMGRYPYTSFLGGLTPQDETIVAESLQQVGFDLSTFDFHLSPFNAHSDGEKQRILIAKALAEKQRILIAKALAQQTPVILLDEPTAHLDLPHRILILRLLRRLAHEQNKTVLISTHELDLALALSDRILLMTPGKGIRLDTAEALKKADAFTSAFGMDIFSPLG